MSIDPINKLGKDLILRGSIEFEGVLEVEGRVEGSIDSGKGNVLVESSASIQGNVTCPTLIVRGEVVGDVTAGEKCVLSSGCKLQGDLRAMRLVLEDGASFWGRSEVGVPPKPVVKSAPRK
jgi:cytoskeletal protein CcmA (bactofilin family)